MIVDYSLEDSATELVAFTMARINLLLPSSYSSTGQLIALRHRMRVQQGSLRMWPGSVPIELSTIALVE